MQSVVGRQADLHVAPRLRKRANSRYGSRMMASASACARGTIEATSRYSSGEWARPPIGPTPQMVGAPTLAAKPESAQPPANSSRTAWPRSPAQDAYSAYNRLDASLATSGLNSPVISRVALDPGR